MGDSGHEEGEEDEEDERGEDIESEDQRHQSDMDSEDADSENEDVDHESDKGERKNFAQNGVGSSEGGLVKLPCDLPSWDTIRGLLEELAR